jgi:hypothetical protein
MERLIALCLLLPACLTAAPKPSETPAVAVFEAKKNIPHASVRIPSLLMTAKGTLIAVAEGPQNPKTPHYFRCINGI